MSNSQATHEKLSTVSPTIWVRHVWNLDALQINAAPPMDYTFDTAAAQEVDEVTSVVLAAYASDPIWKQMMTAITARMTLRIRTTIAASGCEYVVARMQTSIVAVSGIAAAHATDQNLLTGICTLPDHQRKGIGKYLLGLSLLRLRAMGLQRAQVYTECGSLADRKIYPLFGSYREKNVRYPGAERKDMAVETPI